MAGSQGEWGGCLTEGDASAFTEARAEFPGVFQLFAFPNKVIAHFASDFI